MPLLLLPDACELPNTATKARKRARAPEPERAATVVHSSSSTSLSSASSVLSKTSKTSKTSEASSRCSFAPLKRPTGRDSNGRVRIAIMGNCTGMSVDSI